MTIPTIRLGFVKDRIIDNYIGLTTDQLRSKKKTGDFIEGIHWRKGGDGNIYWNFENIQDWLATSEPKKIG